MKEIVKYPTSSANNHHHPLPSLPKKNIYKFLSTSLPNSACSSPKTKGVKDHDQQLEASVALSRLLWLRENHLQRSKSCGEGRPSGAYDEFDICRTTNKTNTNTGAGAGGTPRGQITSDGGRITETNKRNEDDFKCGALCLFLPGFGKGKPVRSRREEIGHVISQRVSLEKFECGSWRSSGILNIDGGESNRSSNRYFDLPLELIRTSGNDASLPVSSAFVFDKDVKGVLKSTKERKSNDCPSRHVRFSTSSPTTSPSSCITPRMRKARDDFNSYLEAQNA
ncbi:hypothetical protein L6452_43424 [Arctium lappa]|uniref:Uncharacterized protein n=1 Tax=Arctium lappa TaxID=4217 RepID=A0ACB8XDC9_ARCLA|nr:hypothetical protein L6452_43424 [Arctium lappa]